MHLFFFFAPLFTPRFSEHYVRFGWWMLSLPLLAGILLLNGAFFLLFKEGRRQRAIRTAAACAIIVIASDLAYYLQAAHRRATVAERACRIEGPSPYGPYEAMICSTGLSSNFEEDAGFVRLRSTQDGTVLAEREFYDPSSREILWKFNLLRVGTSDGSAVIDLPPSWWDRLLARLP